MASDDMVQQNTRRFVQAHVDSFDYLCDTGINLLPQFIRPFEFEAEPSNSRITLKLDSIRLGKPQHAVGKNEFFSDSFLYPSECRLSRKSYESRLDLIFQVFVDGRFTADFKFASGRLPIMVMSKLCNLRGLTSKQLVSKGEEATEVGGYFISNGNEKCLRLLLVSRRNYPLAIERKSWRDRGRLFTEHGLMIRSVRDNCQASVNCMHYLSDSTAVLSFTHRREQFYVPVLMLLKGLTDFSDRQIYEAVVCVRPDDDLLKGAVMNMLGHLHDQGLVSKTKIVTHLGEQFRHLLSLPSWYTNEQIGRYLLNETVCIHLSSDHDKFNFLVFSLQKLYAFVQDEFKAESPDNPMYQEVLLPGHTFLLLLKERIELIMTTLPFAMKRMKRELKIDKTLPTYLSDGLKHTATVGKTFSLLIATGNLTTNTGLGMQHSSGLSIIAEKLNYYRYLAHFRSIHRGSFFVTMRTTVARKLLCEHWGFICPVHTPDGTPCGLLNHLSALCTVIAKDVPDAYDKIVGALMAFKLLPVSIGGQSKSIASFQTERKAGEFRYPVVLDGRVIGMISEKNANAAVLHLRQLKVQDDRNKDGFKFMEVALVRRTKYRAAHPSFYIFTTAARMVRPVMNLCHQRKLEYIGVYEQVFMGSICIEPDDMLPDTNHQELSPSSMLSCIASLTPFSNYNQSPRNVYQCQMGKQTMGSPCHAFLKRADNKLYRIMTPQSPFVKTSSYDEMAMDRYPLGTHAVVAVISYTGYDMEDAMCINKGSFDRGFAHACTYKCEIVDLKRNMTDDRSVGPEIFGCDPNAFAISDLKNYVDADGLPHIGQLYKDGDIYYSSITGDGTSTQAYKTTRFRSMEEAYCDHIYACANETEAGELKDCYVKAAIVWRIVKNPSIGDKFASRHGQKGVCSLLWPQEDMPFTESGMTPDIIFNPHGFPSRMTIGMMIEMMAGKACAMHGKTVDATPFQFDENKDLDAVEYAGKLLTSAGYNFYGNERMYSGVDGREFEVGIFVGICYYQRLRHMVSDKYQIRSTGPVDSITHQPIHGRKKGGGVRFGEMERDSLLSHGASFLLQDRLFNCSDRDIGYVCSKCGSLLSVTLITDRQAIALGKKLTGPQNLIHGDHGRKWSCLLCQTSKHVCMVDVPFVFRYLVAELASCNVHLKLNLKPI